MAVADDERAFLSALLTGSQDAYYECSELVRYGDMADTRHDAILWAIEALHSSNAPVGAQTVCDRLGTRLSKAGGATYVHEVALLGTLASSASFFAERVRCAAALRGVKAAGLRLQAFSDREVEQYTEVEDLVDAARHELEDIALRGVQRYDHAVATMAALESLTNEEEKPVPSPWPTLDSALGGGWRPGCLYYLGARPGVGKTILGVQAATQMAQHGRLASIHSLEMGQLDLLHRMLSSYANVDIGLIQKRHVSLQDEDKWARLSEAYSRIATLPLVIDDSPVQTVTSIRAACRAAAREGRLGLIVVDYVQLMNHTERTESRQQAVSAISRGLKVMAKELHVPVLALSQLNRNGASGRPGLTDLRESGSLEQDADAVMLMHLPEDAPDTLEIDVPKNRFGRPGQQVALWWQPEYMRAVERGSR